MSLGAFFGTTFPHLFFQSYRELAPAPFYKPQTGTNPPAAPPENNSSHQSTFTNPNPHGGQKRAAGKVYTPKIYGFRVSDHAKNGPRMQWMRMRPVSPEELDMVDWRGRWIDDEEEYDEEEEEEDRQMEDFDPVSISVMTAQSSFLRVPSRTLATEKMTMKRKRRKRKRVLVPLDFQQTKPRSGSGGRRRVRLPTRPRRLLQRRVFPLGRRSQ